jgi:hypothetical protein
MQGVKLKKLTDSILSDNIKAKKISLKILVKMNKAGVAGYAAGFLLHSSSWFGILY